MSQISVLSYLVTHLQRLKPGYIKSYDDDRWSGSKKSVNNC